MEGAIKAIQLDAAVNPGNSGGPVIDQTGKVVGVIVSGIPGARVNFAIPVPDVKKFLKRPGVIHRPTAVDFTDRHKPQQIDVEVLPTVALSGEISVEVVTLYRESQPKVTAKRVGDVYRAAIKPVLDDDERVRLQLAALVDGHEQTVDVDDREIKLGAESFRLQEVRRVQRRRDLTILTLVNGEKLAGKLTGLDGITNSNGVAFNLDKLEEIHVRAYGELIQARPYRVIVKAGGEVVAESSYVMPIGNVPATAGRSLFDPDDPYAPKLNTISVQVFVDRNTTLYVNPEGLQFTTHEYGEAPGKVDEDGSYILINGRKWYPQWKSSKGRFGTDHQSSVYPLKIGNVNFTTMRVAVGPDLDGDDVPNAGRIETSTGFQGRIAVKMTQHRQGRAWFHVRLLRRGIATRLPPLAGPVPDHGLDAHWTFDHEPKWFEDASGNKHRLRFSTPYREKGQVGNAMRFHGSGYIELPKLDALDFDRTDRFSIGGWAWTHGGRMVLLGSMRTGRQYRGFNLSVQSKKASINLVSRWKPDALSVTTKNEIPVKEWVHLMATHDGTGKAKGLRLYVNGRPVDLTVNTDRLRNSIQRESGLVIGSRGGDSYFSGSLDDLRAYSRTLSESEVAAIYTAGKSGQASPGDDKPSGLVGHWTFDDVLGLKVHDQSGNKHHGYMKSLLKLPLRMECGLGRAMRFQSGDFLFSNTAGNFESNEPWTMAMWVFATESKPMTLLSRSSRFPAVGYDLALTEQGRLQATIASSKATGGKRAIDVLSNDSVPFHRWQHVAMTYDGSRKAAGVALYINGAGVNATTEQDTLDDASIKGETPLTIGAPAIFGPHVTKDRFDGYMDDVRVYRRALTAKEVAALAGKP